MFFSNNLKRNGHKYTHESRKPHACHFCDKSYSDSRSLRRHYENAHPEENESWLLLSQATNGDTSTIAAAAAALLSSTSLDPDSFIANTNGTSSGGSMDPESDQLSSNTHSAVNTLFNALNQTNKLKVGNSRSKMQPNNSLYGTDCKIGKYLFCLLIYSIKTITKLSSF